MVVSSANPVFRESDDLSKPKAVLRVYLKYGPEGEKIIRQIRRYSKPGLRVYKKAAELRPVLDGLGIAIISTSRGVMSDRRARSERVGHHGLGPHQLAFWTPGIRPSLAMLRKQMRQMPNLR